MKYLMVLSLVAWLQLGASLQSSAYSQRLAEVEERLQRLEALVTQQEDVVTNEKTSDVIDLESDPVVITGCGAEATEHLGAFAEEIINHYPSHITSVTV